MRRQPERTCRAGWTIRCIASSSMRPARTSWRSTRRRSRAASWGSPLIADGKVYIGDEDGDITIFKLSAEKDIIAEISMKSAVYSTPIVANGVLYLANKSALYAIQEGTKSKPLAPAPEGGATDE